MDPYNEEAAAKYMMDAINEDTRVNAAEQFSAKEARTADLFLNMSGDGSDGDDDVTPTPRSSTYLNYASQSCGSLRSTIMAFINISFVTFSRALHRSRKGDAVLPKNLREDRSSQKWTQRAVHVLQRLLAPSLSHNVGLLFGREFRSPQDSGNRAIQKNNNTPSLHTRRKCYGQN